MSAPVQHDAPTVALAAELGRVSGLLESIDRKLDAAIARPEFDRLFTVINGVTASDSSQAIDLGMRGKMLVRVWQAHSNVAPAAANPDAAVYVLQGELNLARCQARVLVATTQEADGVVAVPAAGVAEFLLDDVSHLTVYFDHGAVKTQAVTVRITSLEHQR